LPSIYGVHILHNKKENFYFSSSLFIGQIAEVQWLVHTPANRVQFPAGEIADQE